MSNLTDKQRLFISEYLSTFNATEAAKRAGYSKDTAYAIGWENLRKPEIASEIKKYLDNHAMTAEEVLARLAEQARGEYSNYITEDGEVDIALLVRDKKAHLIKSLKNTSHGVQIEFYDAQYAISQLAKHHGLAAETLRLEGDIEHKFEVGPEDAEKIFDILSSVGATTAEPSHTTND